MGFLLSLIVAEGTARLLEDGGRGRGYSPVDTKRRWRGPTNARGYRDDEHPLAKPPATRRVVALGDSFTWGVGVEFEDAWPQRLERALTRRRSERWEVVSLAKPGMNTVEEAEQLATEGFAYEPDLVVLGYCLNDSEDDTAAETRRARDWEALREARQAHPGLLADHSALYRMVSRRLWATREGHRRVAAYHSQYAPDYAGWMAAQGALRRMAALSQDRKVPLVVMVFPLFGNPLDRRYPFADIHADVGMAVAQAGWAHPLDLLPAYRGLDWRLLVVDGENDEHPNEIAHRIATNVLVSTLDDLLPPPSASAPQAPASRR